MVKTVGSVLALGVLTAVAWWVFGGAEEPEPRDSGRVGLPATAAPVPAETGSPAAAAEASPAAVVAERYPGERAETEPAGAARPAGDGDLVIETVDSAGAAVADVPLVFRAPGGSRGRNPIWSGRTGPDGKAEVNGGIRKLTRLRPADAPELACGFPETEPTTVALDPAHPPEGPVRFVVPPAGRVIVSLLDSSRAPLPDEASVAFHLVSPGADGRNDGPEVLVAARNGIAELPRIGLGGEVLAISHCDTRPEAKARAPGPRAAGETLRMELVFEDPYPVLVGRAVDAAQVPIPSESFRITVRATYQHGSSSTGTSLRTDGEGRFRYVLSTTFKEGGTRVFALTRNQKSGSDATVEIDLSRVLPPGETDLGDIVLASGAGPVGASGRVIDAAAQGVGGANVEYCLLTGKDQHVFSTADVKADDQGRFTIELTGKATAIRLTASGPGFLESEAQDVAVGATGVEIVLGREGVVTGSLLLDDDVARGRVRLALRSPDAPPPLVHRGPTDVPPKADGTFRFKGLRPGRHEFTVRLVGEAAPCVEVKGIDVREGENPKDPRLQEIDLRGRLRTITVTVLRPDGRRAADGRLVVAPAGPDRSHVEGFLLNGAPVKIVSSAPAVDLVAAVDGFRLARAASVAADHVIHLQPALRVRCVVTDDVRSPGAPVIQKIGLDPVAAGGPEAGSWLMKLYDGDRPRSTHSGSGGTGPPLWEPQAVPVDGSGVAVIAVAEPGRYRIRIWRDHLNPQVIPGTPIPEFIEVVDSPVDQVVSIRCQ